MQEKVNKEIQEETYVDKTKSRPNYIYHFNYTYHYTYN